VTGQTVMSVFPGAKPIEFEKGKAGVLVASKGTAVAHHDFLPLPGRAGRAAGSGGETEGKEG